MEISIKNNVITEIDGKNKTTYTYIHLKEAEKSFKSKLNEYIEKLIKGIEND